MLLPRWSSSDAAFGSSVCCLSALPARAQERLDVVASFSILGDLVRNVGGERVSVTTLVGPDGDVHVYTPAPADAKKVADAKLVVINGLGLEGWLPRLVQSSGSKAAIVTATQGIAPRTLGSHADPHAWQSVVNAKLYVANIRDALGAADPANAGIYRANAAAYLAKLDALDREVRDAVAQIPQERRKVISTHKAFGYFGDAYGIEFIAPLGVSTESEASARDIAGYHHPGQVRQNTGDFSGKYQRSQANPADIGRDRRQDRRNAVFRQPDRRKGRRPHLH